MTNVELVIGMLNDHIDISTKAQGMLRRMETIPELNRYEGRVEAFKEALEIVETYLSKAPSPKS